MIEVIRSASADPHGRVIALDFTSSGGPYIRLTAAQWRELLVWIRDYGDKI